MCCVSRRHRRIWTGVICDNGTASFWHPCTQISTVISQSPSSMSSHSAPPLPQLVFENLLEVTGRRPPLPRSPAGSRPHPRTVGAHPHRAQQAGAGSPGTREVSPRPRPRPRRSLQQKQAPALGKAGRPAAHKLGPQRAPHGGPPARPSRPWGTPPLRASSGPGRSSGAGSRVRARRSSPRPRPRPAGRPPAHGPARRR